MRDTYGIEATSVSNGVDLTRYSTRRTHHDETVRQRLGIEGSPIVLALGGIEARKNTLGLLDAFAGLVGRHPNARLVVAGGASLLDHDTYARAFMDRAATL